MKMLALAADDIQTIEHIKQLSQQIDEAERLAQRRDEFLDTLEVLMLSPAERSFISLRSEAAADELNDLKLELHYHVSTLAEPTSDDILDSWNMALEPFQFEDHFLPDDARQLATEDSRHFHVMH